MGGSLGMNSRQPRQSISESELGSPDVNAHFRKLNDDRTLFYPLSIFGRCGFVVASTEQEALLRIHARGAHKASTIGLLLSYQGFIAIGVIFAPSQWLVPWLVACVIAMLLTAMHLFLRFSSRHLTEGMESANVRNSPIA